LSLLAVDGNSVAWRTFHAMGGLSGGGMATGMAFGFLRMLREALAKTKVDACRVAWDGGRPAFRVAAWPGYKAKRQEHDDKEVARRALFHQQQAWLSEVLPQLGVHQMLLPGWEADDIVAMWALTAGDRNVAVMSGDRDLWQLVSRNVIVLRPGEAALTLRNFQDVTGVPTPGHWLWFRVLTGDKSDGIPGVGGIGPKRGQKLVLDEWPVRKLLAALDPPRRTLAARNFVLMNLRRSGMDLHQAVQDHAPAQLAMTYGTLADARKVISAAEMQSLSGANEWGDWSAPFRRLTAGAA
jgi:DNA polymerase I